MDRRQPVAAAEPEGEPVLQELRGRGQGLGGAAGLPRRTPAPAQPDPGPI